MKHLILLLILPYSLIGQEIEDKRWFSQAEINITVPNKDKTIYSFNTNTIDIKENRRFENGGIVLKGKIIYSTDFSMNYLVSKRFSIGALTGINHFRNPIATALKLGGVIRYELIEDSFGYAFVQFSGFFPLHNVKTSTGEAKIGLSIPLLVEESYSIGVIIHASYTSFTPAKPLFADETPDLVEYRGVGFGFGIRF